MKFAARFAWAPVLASTLVAQVGVFDLNGRLSAVVYDDDQIAVLLEPGVVDESGKRFIGTGFARDVARRMDGQWLSWEGTVAVEGLTFRYEQRARWDKSSGISLQLRLWTPSGNVELRPVVRFTLPRDTAAGADAVLENPESPPVSVRLPVERPEQSTLWSGRAQSLSVAPILNGLTLRLVAGATHTVELRHLGWNGYLIQLGAEGSETQEASFSVELTMEGQADRRPVQLRLDATQGRFLLHGFGGNYCFNIDSPVTDFTLSTLRVAWARTEMTLRDWEPDNDNDSPYDINWAYFEAQDRPGTELHQEFLLAQRIQRMGIPYITSIWHIPRWMWADPTRPASAHGHRVPRERWDELIESITAYLLYAKQRYGVEPDLFSFNEPNIGVYVLFTPEEHRDFIKRLGARFEELGLKTRMLLADATGPRGTHTYALPTAEDPEALRYVGAVAFHSWGGATPEEYQAWGDLAEKLKLPLLVAELGVDAQAWRGRLFDSFAYGIREAAMYQELLLYARPQATLHWEFTPDYGIVNVVRDAEGAAALVPSPRYWLIKHFTDLTPRFAQALATSSDHPRVLCTAFAKSGSEGAIYTLHVLNSGAGRLATLSGLPADLGRLRVILTDETRHFVELPPVVPQEGTVQLWLPARSLLTLTNAPVR